MLIFLWLPSADLAVARVAGRVRQGGHDIPEATIRRRFDAGLGNFFRWYAPVVDSWSQYDGSRLMSPLMKASPDQDSSPNPSHELTQPANAAFRQAAIKVVEKAREHDTPVVLWDDATGTVQYVSPEEYEDRDRHAGIEAERTQKTVLAPEQAVIPPR